MIHCSRFNKDVPSQISERLFVAVQPDAVISNSVAARVIHSGCCNTDEKPRNWRIVGVIQVLDVGKVAVDLKSLGAAHYRMAARFNAFFGISGMLGSKVDWFGCLVPDAGQIVAKVIDAKGSDEYFLFCFCMSSFSNPLMHRWDSPTLMSLRWGMICDLTGEAHVKCFWSGVDFIGLRPVRHQSFGPLDVASIPSVRSTGLSRLVRTDCCRPTESCRMQVTTPLNCFGRAVRD
jgi:hypothetical protein